MHRRRSELDWESRNGPEVWRDMFGTGTKSGRRTSFRTGRNIEGEKI